MKKWCIWVLVIVFACGTAFILVRRQQRIAWQEQMEMQYESDLQMIEQQFIENESLLSEIAQFIIAQESISSVSFAEGHGLELYFYQNGTEKTERLASGVFKKSWPELYQLAKRLMDKDFKWYYIGKSEDSHSVISCRVFSERYSDTEFTDFFYVYSLDKPTDCFKELALNWYLVVKHSPVGE